MYHMEIKRLGRGYLITVKKNEQLLAIEPVMPFSPFAMHKLLYNFCRDMGEGRWELSEENALALAYYLSPSSKLVIRPVVIKGLRYEFEDFLKILRVQAHKVG